MNTMERLLGELDGKMDLVLQRLDKINGTIGRHEAWISAHEQLHASQAGAGCVKASLGRGAWQVFLLILSPIIAAVVAIIMR